MKKIKKNNKLTLLVAFIVIAIATLSAAGDFLSSLLHGEAGDNEEKNVYVVDRVVDGDTFWIKDYKFQNGAVADTKIRLLGINAPESVHSDESKNTAEGKIASDYLNRLISGQTIYLELDKEELDKYDRVLAYVYLDDGTFINEHLIEEGYAEVVKIEPNTKYYTNLKIAENKAKEKGKGIWQ